MTVSKTVSSWLLPTAGKDHTAKCKYARTNRPNLRKCVIVCVVFLDLISMSDWNISPSFHRTMFPKFAWADIVSRKITNRLSCCKIWKNLFRNMFKCSTCFVIQNNSSSIYTKVNYCRNFSKETFDLSETKKKTWNFRVWESQHGILQMWHEWIKTWCPFLAESCDFDLRTSRWEVWDLTDDGSLFRITAFIFVVSGRCYLKMSSICIWLYTLVSLAHPGSHSWIKLEAFDCTHAQTKLCADMAPFDRAQEHVPRGRSIWDTLFPRWERPLICAYWQAPPPHPHPLERSGPFNERLKKFGKKTQTYHFLHNCH